MAAGCLFLHNLTARNRSSHRPLGAVVHAIVMCVCYLCLPVIKQGGWRGRPQWTCCLLRTGLQIQQLHGFKVTVPLLQATKPRPINATMQSQRSSSSSASVLFLPLHLWPRVAATVPPRCHPGNPRVEKVPAWSFHKNNASLSSPLTRPATDLKPTFVEL